MFAKSLVASLAFLSAFAFAQYPGAKRVPSEWREGFNSITVEQAKPILSWLAGPQFNGRNPDSGDFFAAAGYVSTVLNGLGLEPGGDKGSFLQRYVVSTGTVIPSQTELRSDDGALKLPYGQNFAAGAHQDVDVPLKFAFVHVGKDADASKLDWSQLAGRWVLMTSESNENAIAREKFTKGARDVKAIYWHVPSTRAAPITATNIRAIGVKGIDDPERPRFTNAQINLAGALAIAQKCNALAYLAKSPTVASIELSEVPFTVQVRVTKEEKPACNVVGILRGSDPALRDEYMVVGSHLDHLGVSDRGTRFGADDNGSGCTANLLIARAMNLNPVKPKRTVVYVFYDHEESGLYGSLYFVNRLPIPLDKLVACFNMDMVGRNENRGPEIAENNWNVVYPGIVQLNSPDFYEHMVRVNQYVNLRLKPDREDRTFRTDTGNYVRLGIPTIKVFTGEHEDYHQIGDTVDNINWEKMTNVAKWVYLGIQELAATSTKPKFQTKAFTALPYHILAGHAKVANPLKLAKNATLTIELVESLAGASTGSAILGRSVLYQGASTPYELFADRTLFKAERTYTLRFTVFDGKTAKYISKEPLAVPAVGWTRAQDVNLDLAPGG
ncbi:MAG: M20/M25/M40 family metallo-hydrolase [Fimbriimonadaceae bacterium]|nr:M20/M25/M40 family metallo-hydrolase [Fimbriimonadaceae bacterium]